MTSSVQVPNLPEYLLTSWRLRKDDSWQAKKRRDLKGWKASSLTEAYLKYQLGNCNRVQEAQEHAKTIAPTLSSIAAGKVLDVLNTSDSFDADLRTITKSLNSTTVRQLLADSRTPYLVLRAFQDFLQEQTTSEAKISHRGVIDTDDAILANERYIRSRGEVNRDGKYLVSLKGLSRILLGSPDSSIDDAKITFVRKDPPKGGLEFLDAFRERIMHIQPNDASFVKTFERITRGALNGLDWRNVLVAGGMVLTTLTHVDPSKDDDSSVKDCDIDLYLYGLGPEEANRKVEEIYHVWCSNLPSTNQQKLVVKNAKTINLLPDHPNRRIQIILKLLPSPTHVLLNFDLDACTTGFDGSHVFMLPRFARAIETGYSVFTMDLIWGHHLGDRRATQEKRIFKYADRGFGLRILPSYAKSLEEDNLEKGLDHVYPEDHKVVLADNDTNNQDDNDSDMNNQDDTDSDMEFPPEIAMQPERNRKPDGPEPGLKTLKRIAYLGQDHVNRFYFGLSSRTADLSGIYPINDDDSMDEVDTDGSPAERTEIIDHQLRERWVQRVQVANVALREADANQRLRLAAEYGPFMSFIVLDTGDMHGELPDGRRGLGTFELFMRHCEVWRLHALAYATLDQTSFASLAYDPDTYDDLPSYSWDEDLDLDSFAQEIDFGNDKLFGSLKAAICGKLGIDFRRGGYSNYLTRRIRRQVHGPDLASVQEKQITVPLIIPYDLENFILNDISNQYPDLPHNYTAFKPLISVHDPAAHDPATATLPSLQDTVAESGNLRYWVVTNESMWAGQHRVMDEISEVLWSLFHWFNHGEAMDPERNTGNNNTDDDECAWYLARMFRRRIVLPELPTDDIQHTNVSNRRSGLPTLRESILFRPWAFYTPKIPDRTFYELNDDDEAPHPLYDRIDEDRMQYPFPDHLFWTDGDEGQWDGDDVPLWSDVGKDVKAGDGIRRRELEDDEGLIIQDLMDLMGIRAGNYGGL